MTTFNKKQLVVEIITSNGEYTITDLSIKAVVENAGLPSLDNADIKIYGLSKDLMKTLSFLQYRQLEASNNIVNLYWRDEGIDKLAFTGNIVNAYPVFRQAPDVYFQIQAITGYTQSLIIDTPYSSNGEIKIQNIAKKIVEDMGKSFTNNGVDITGQDVYLSGSRIGNLNSLSNDYDYNTVINKNSVLISPKEKPTSGTLTIIDCSKGLVNGFIENSQDGIYLSTFYNPNFVLNGLVRVINSFNETANGDWQTTGIVHSLSSQIDGEFFSNLKLSYFKYER